MTLENVLGRVKKNLRAGKVYRVPFLVNFRGRPPFRPLRRAAVILETVLDWPPLRPILER